MTTDIPPIKEGDLLYAVGPGSSVPSGPTDLQVYSAVVQRVTYGPQRIQGDFVTSFELADRRPTRGFPKWTYRDHEIGILVHRSALDALHAFAERARHRRDSAEQAKIRADQEDAWAMGQALALRLEAVERELKPLLTAPPACGVMLELDNPESVICDDAGTTERTVKVPNWNVKP